MNQKTPSGSIKLPGPGQESHVSLEKALLLRRSVRHYADEPLALPHISQLLWAAQGVTSPTGFRTAPSAGALYPLETYLAVGNVGELPAGIYVYRPLAHVIVKHDDRDRRDDLYRAALNQAPIRNAPAVLIFSAIYERTTIRYGERGIRYVHMEAGHAAQNVCLQATALNLATVVIGAFHDEQVKKVMNLGENEHPLYIVPIGKPKGPE